MAAAAVPIVIAALSAASSFFQNKGGSKKYGTLGEDQQSFQDEIINMLRGQFGSKDSAFGESQKYLQNLFSGNPEASQAFEAPYKRQFNEEIIPGIANRFAGMGAGNLSSSAFQNALAGAGTSLQEKLAAIRSNLQSQALPYAQQGLNPLLGAAFSPRFNTGVTPGGPGALAQTIGPIAGAYGEGFGKSAGASNFAQLQKDYPKIFGGP